MFKQFLSKKPNQTKPNHFQFFNLLIAVQEYKILILFKNQKFLLAASEITINSSSWEFNLLYNWLAYTCYTCVFLRSTNLPINSIFLHSQSFLAAHVNESPFNFFFFFFFQKDFCISCLAFPKYKFSFINIYLLQLSFFFF